MEPLAIHPIALMGLMVICYMTGYYVGAVSMAQRIREMLARKTKDGK
jgi:hypothetical protein